MKKVGLILSALLLLTAIPLMVFMVSQQQRDIRSKAAPATTLSFSPATKNICVGETTQIAINIDTGTNSAASTDLTVLYNPQIMEVMDIKMGTFLEGAQEQSKNINSVDGNATIAFFLSATNVVKSKKGTGVLATMTVKGKSPGTATLKFDPDTTALFGVGEDSNIWTKNQITGTYSVTTACGTPTAGASPTATIVPTAQPTTGVLPTATPYPTYTPQPTQAPQPTSAPLPTSPPSVVRPPFRITYPPVGAVVTTSTPTIQGISETGCNITLALSGAQSFTSVASTDSNGYFGYTVTSPLPDGSYSVIGTEQCAGQSPRTVQTTFTIRTQAIPVTGSATTTLLTIAGAVMLTLFGFRFFIL